jgi:hypothetical protein
MGGDENNAAAPAAKPDADVILWAEGKENCKGLFPVMEGVLPSEKNPRRLPSTVSGVTGEASNESTLSNVPAVVNTGGLLLDKPTAWI